MRMSGEDAFRSQMRERVPSFTPLHTCLRRLRREVGQAESPEGARQMRARESKECITKRSAVTPNPSFPLGERQYKNR